MVAKLPAGHFATAKYPENAPSISHGFGGSTSDVSLAMDYYFFGLTGCGRTGGSSDFLNGVPGEDGGKGAGRCGVAGGDFGFLSAPCPEDINHLLPVSALSLVNERRVEAVNGTGRLPSLFLITVPCDEVCKGTGLPVLSRISVPLEETGNGAGRPLVEIAEGAAAGGLAIVFFVSLILP